MDAVWLGAELAIPLSSNAKNAGESLHSCSKKVIGPWA